MRLEKNSRPGSGSPAQPAAKLTTTPSVPGLNDYLVDLERLWEATERAASRVPQDAQAQGDDRFDWIV